MNNHQGLPEGHCVEAALGSNVDAGLLFVLCPYPFPFPFLSSSSSSSSPCYIIPPPRPSLLTLHYDFFISANRGSSQCPSPLIAVIGCGSASTLKSSISMLLHSVSFLFFWLEHVTPVKQAKEGV